jgi:hypothetical protein
MKGIDLKPELEEMVRLISQKNMYGGNKIPDSIMKMFTIDITDFHDGVLVPYWLGVLQRGRGPRKGTKGSGLVNRIYRWMEKRNMFESTTSEGRMNEARSVTWYINKYGNKQFRNKTFVDIYETVRKDTIEKIDDKFGATIHKITMEVI